MVHLPLYRARVVVTDRLEMLTKMIAYPLQTQAQWQQEVVVITWTVIQTALDPDLIEIVTGSITGWEIVITNTGVRTVGITVARLTAEEGIINKTKAHLIIKPKMVETMNGTDILMA